ncbi:spermidine synthase [Sphingomonas sp.]|uniref:spermidine synthase n=1 Tax=Sphingomonas sp. TaxID=28214 RepID=UPI003AFF98DF
MADASPPGFLTMSANVVRAPARNARINGTSATAPVKIIESAPIPGGGTLQLARCGGEFSIQFCTDELMGSHDHISEEALATMACERLGGSGDRILIGGLGMGFTLRAALSAWPASTRIVVAELVPEIVAWANGPLAHLHGDSLSDPRVAIELADVHDVIAATDAAFDAILLDVDNGPDGFMRAENDRIYCAWGLASAYAALRPNGVLAVWSAYPDADFQSRLEDVGFRVEEVDISAFEGSVSERHHIWLAEKRRTLSRRR